MQDNVNNSPVNVEPCHIDCARQLYPSGVPAEFDGMEEAEFFDGIQEAVAGFEAHEKRLPREAAELDAWMNSKDEFTQYLIDHPIDNASATAPAEESKDASKEGKKKKKGKKSAPRTDYASLLTLIVGAFARAESAMTANLIRAGIHVWKYLTAKHREMGADYTYQARANQVKVIEVELIKVGLEHNVHTVYQCAMIAQVLTGDALKLADAIDSGDVRALPWGAFKSLMTMVYRKGDTEEWAFSPAGEDGVKLTESAIRNVWDNFVAGKEGYRTGSEVSSQWDRLRGKVKAQKAETTTASAPQASKEAAPATVKEESKEAAPADNTGTVTVAPPDGSPVEAQPEESKDAAPATKPTSLLAMSNTRPAIVAGNIAETIAAHEDAPQVLTDLAQHYLEPDDFFCLLCGIAEREDAQAFLSKIIGEAKNLLDDVVNSKSAKKSA